MSMLVLNRSYDEEIVVTVPPSLHPVKIKIAYLGQLKGRPRFARIGVQAPDEVPILRGEINVVE